MSLFCCKVYISKKIKTKEGIMQYKKKYYTLLCSLLLIILSISALYFTKDRFEQVTGENAGEIVDVEVDGDESNQVADSTLKKINFSNFSTALRFSQNYLKTTSGYRTKSLGNIVQDVKGIAKISQNLVMETEINNKNNSSRTIIGTWGEKDKVFKANYGCEFVRFGNEITYRDTNDRTEDYSRFDFTNQELTQKSVDEYLQEWAILPEKVFTSFTLQKVKNGTLIKTNKKDVVFELNFTVDQADMLVPAEIFIKTMCGNTDICKKINPTFDDGNIVIWLDAYGRPVNAKYSFKYDLDLRSLGIPLSGLKGYLTYSQKFYGYNSSIKIEQLQEKVAE